MGKNLREFLFPRALDYSFSKVLDKTDPTYSQYYWDFYFYTWLTWKRAKNCKFLVIPFRNFVPLRFRKAGRVLCGGARETHWATCHNEVTPSKSKEFLKSPFFFTIQNKPTFRKWKKATPYCTKFSKISYFALSLKDTMSTALLVVCRRSASCCTFCGNSAVPYWGGLGEV